MVGGGHLWGMESSQGVMILPYKLSDGGLSDHAVMKLEIVQQSPEWMDAVANINRK